MLLKCTQMLASTPYWGQRSGVGLRSMVSDVSSSGASLSELDTAAQLPQAAAPFVGSRAGFGSRLFASLGRASGVAQPGAQGSPPPPNVQGE
jgi:hypothetical protein